MLMTLHVCRRACLSLNGSVKEIVPNMLSSSGLEIKFKQQKITALQNTPFKILGAVLFPARFCRWNNKYFRFTVAVFLYMIFSYACVIIQTKYVPNYVFQCQHVKYLVSRQVVGIWCLVSVSVSEMLLTWKICFNIKLVLQTWCRDPFSVVI